VCTSVAGETAAFATAFRSSRAAIPEPIGISQMRRLKDKVFRKKVGVSPNKNDLTRSQQSTVSDYVLPDVRYWKASSEFDDTEDVVVVPENDWRCRTCLWTAGSTIFTLRGTKSPQYFIHVEEGAIQGCPRCNIVVQCVNRLGIKRENNIIEFINGHYRDPDWFRLQEDPHPPFQVFCSAYDGRGRRTATMLPMNPLGQSTSSPESLSWAAYRLRRCLQSHSDCNVTKEPFRPTRLLNVNSVHPDVILEDAATLPAMAEYAALSHCWGKRPITCRTTKSNYWTAARGVPWKSLPQSFQDAITVTRALCLDYLWIDSISIIQDDEHDWNRESSKMFEVYNRAQVTLAAVHACDSSEGLFVDRSQFQVRLDDIQFSEVRSSIYTRRIHSPFHSWEPKDLPNQSPLFDRAWAYQERLVSPRTLYFTEREILWECLKETACECKEDDIATSPKQQYQLGLGKSSGAPQWHHIVSEFSRLDLTVESDRFPAISAVARSMGQARPNAEYLAGLWSDSLSRDLLWKSKTPSKGRPKSKLAPSWSWVSVLSGVEFIPSGSRPLFEVVEAICTRGDNDTTIPVHGSQVINGKLTLTGRILQLEIGLEISAQQGTLIHAQTKKKLKFFPDCQSPSKGDMEVQEVCALALTSNASHEPKSFSCLVLSRDQG
jgi:hypothetical protein